MTLPQSSSQQQSQHFLLKWNNHRSNMVNVFESLLQSENLVDVTLAVEGKFLKAHKIVLSACSPYFQAMFVNQTPVEKHPILIFHDMKFAHLKTLLEFMYRGEISIDEKDLSDVLKVAEALSIRGLSSFESDDEDSEKSSEHGSGSNNANSNNSSNNGHQNSGNNSHHNNSQGHTNSNHGVSNANGPPSNSGHMHHHFQNFNNNNSHTNPSHSSSSNSNSNPISDNQYHQVNNNASSNNVSCDSSINVNGSGGGAHNSHSHGHGHQGHKTKAAKERSHSNNLSAAVNSTPDKKVAAAKKRRGRQPKKNLPGENQITEAVKIPGAKGQARIPDLKPVASGGRQGVRRRIPRRYAGTPSQPPLKREKISDGEHSPDLDPEGDLFLSPDLSSSEPLSEMSVRGLDLFKYASIEDGVYRCIECEKLRIPKTFKNKYSFQRHAFLYHEGNMRKVFPCPVCSREFSRPDKMKNHLRSIHQGDKERQGRGHSRTPPSSTEAQNSVNTVSPGTNSSLNSELYLDPCDF